MAITAGALLAAVIVAFSLASYVTFNETHGLDRSWAELRERADRKHELITRLEAELGYGGFIHSFKNYVLRGDTEYVARFEDALSRLRQTIGQSYLAGLTDAEESALQRVEEVIDTYARNFPIAIRMHQAGAPVAEIDRAVRIEDGPATAALGQLQRAAAKAREAADRRMRQLTHQQTYVWLAYGVATLLVVGLAGLLFRSAYVNARRAYGLDRMEAGFKALLEVSRDGLISLTSDFRIASFNAAAEQIFGYRARDVLGEPLGMLLPEPYRMRHEEDLREFAAGPEVVREMSNWRKIRGLTRDGREIPMMGAISKRRYKGETILSVTLRDMSDALHVEEKLQEANRAALDAARAKSRFFATISHELRTPLNGIIGFAQAIEQELFGPISNDKYKEYAGLIQHSGEKLQHLVSNVIDFAAMETGRHQPTVEDVDPVAAAEAVIGEVAVSARTRRIDCQLRAADGLTRIQADRRGLNQVLLNLLSNSVKYTHPGGSIELYIAVEGDHTVFRVSDTGVGIPAQSLDHVTEPFGHGGTTDPLTANRTTDGPGLGLAIVREVVEAHGGMLHIESEVNVGTVVTVMWPNVAGAIDRQPAADAMVGTAEPG